MSHAGQASSFLAALGPEAPGAGHFRLRRPRLSRAQVAQLGLGLGSVLSSGVRKYIAVAGAGLGLLFLKLGRDDETQADQLGFRYALEDGYDVREMIGVFRMFDQEEKLSGGGRLPEWQATHPDPETGSRRPSSRPRRRREHAALTRDSTDLRPAPDGSQPATPVQLQPDRPECMREPVVDRSGLPPWSPLAVSSGRSPSELAHNPA